MNRTRKTSTRRNKNETANLTNNPIIPCQLPNNEISLHTKFIVGIDVTVRRYIVVISVIELLFFCV